MKVIYGHLYNCYYTGIFVYWIDGKNYYDPDEAAKALGLTIEQFKEVW